MRGGRAVEVGVVAVAVFVTGLSFVAAHPPSFGSVDAGLSTAGGRLGPSPSTGDCVRYDDNGATGCSRTTDTAPNNVAVTAQASAPTATAGNRTGSQLILAGGIGSKTVAIDAFGSCAGAAVTAKINGVDCTCTEGVGWARGASNGAACASLATCLEACVGIGATCATATVNITKDATTAAIFLSETAAACTTVANNTDGTIKSYSDFQTGIGVKLCLDDDCTTHLFASANDIPAIVANGVTRLTWSGATEIKGASYIEESPARATPGSATASAVWRYTETQNSIVTHCLKVGSGTPLCFQPPQDVVNSTCTAGQFTIDTGGATVEECYCSAANTWRCHSMGTGNPTD